MKVSVKKQQQTNYIYHKNFTLLMLLKLFKYN